MMPRWFWLAAVVGMLLVPGCSPAKAQPSCARTFDASGQPESNEVRVTGCIPQ